MNISDEKLLEGIKKIRKTDKNKELEKIKLSSILSFDKNLEISFNKTIEIVKKEDLFNSLSFLQWNNAWNKYGIYGKYKKENRNAFADKTYSRGRLLFVDFGQSNMGLEFSYQHIGIVLKDFGDLITVIPVTSNKGQQYSHNIDKSIIRVNKKDYNQFDNNSILLIHQARSIGKNRIIKDLFKTINHTNLMEEIEQKIILSYCTISNKKNNDTITELNKEIGRKNLEIEELNKKLKESSVINNIDKK